MAPGMTKMRWCVIWWICAYLMSCKAHYQQSRRISYRLKLMPQVINVVESNILTDGRTPILPAEEFDGPRHTINRMMTSSNWNISRVTDHLCVEFTGHRWIPRTKASDAELWCFLSYAPGKKRLSKQSWGWWFETPSHSLWRHCNGLSSKDQSHKFRNAPVPYPTIQWKRKVRISVQKWCVV